MGFGKTLWRYQGKQTEYVLAAIPLGGYVKMLDEREGVVSDEERPFAFNQNRPPSRVFQGYQQPEYKALGLHHQYIGCL